MNRHQPAGWSGRRAQQMTAWGIERDDGDLGDPVAGCAGILAAALLTAATIVALVLAWLLIAGRPW